MTLSSQIIPVIVLLAANLMSGKHGSFPWETVTAVFVWTAVVSLLAFMASLYIALDGAARDYLFQAAAFCLLTALARDYERILRPFSRRYLRAWLLLSAIWAVCCLVALAFASDPTWLAIWDLFGPPAVVAAFLVILAVPIGILFLVFGLIAHGKE